MNRQGQRQEDRRRCSCLARINAGENTCHRSLPPERLFESASGEPATTLMFADNPCRKIDGLRPRFGAVRELGGCIWPAMPIYVTTVDLCRSLRLGEATNRRPPPPGNAMTSIDTLRRKFRDAHTAVRQARCPRFHTHAARRIQDNVVHRCSSVATKSASRPPRSVQRSRHCIPASCPGGPAPKT